MSDREALAAALEQDVGKNPTPLLDSAWWKLRKVEREAARERLAQLPEKCEHGESEPHAMTGPSICTGKVYPAELVERINKVLFHDNDLIRHSAVAVLDALNGEAK